MFNKSRNTVKLDTQLNCLENYRFRNRAARYHGKALFMDSGRNCHKV